MRVASYHASFQSISGVPPADGEGCPVENGDSIGACMRSEVRNMPVVGKLASDIDCIFVDRDKKDSRRAAMDAINAHVPPYGYTSRRTGTLTESLTFLRSFQYT